MIELSLPVLCNSGNKKSLKKNGYDIAPSVFRLQPSSNHFILNAFSTRNSKI